MDAPLNHTAIPSHLAHAGGVAAPHGNLAPLYASWVDKNNFNTPQAHLSHSNIADQNSELGEEQRQRMPLPFVPDDVLPDEMLFLGINPVMIG